MVQWIVDTLGPYIVTVATSKDVLVYLTISLLPICAFMFVGPRLTSKLPLPPGPKPWPIIGNLLDLPKNKAWITYQLWSQQYGDVIYLNALGQKMVILGSAEATNELFERRGLIYSNRFRRTMGSQLMGFKWMMTAWDNGDRLRQARKLLHTHLNLSEVGKHHPVQLAAARRMAIEILEAPQEPASVPRIVHFNFARSVVKMVYGIEVESPESEYVSGPERVLEALNLVIVPGRFLVDFIPWLRYVPKWMPGADFQHLAEQTRELHQRTRDVPFLATKAAMAQDTAPESLLRNILETFDSVTTVTSSDGEQFIKDTAGMMYIGAVDTTVSCVISFVLAMILHPEVQAKGQAEIDRVIGNDRLPEMSDRDQLPYVSAIVDECYRWIPVAPLAIPHVPEQDDVYKGYIIPKGTIVFGSVWAILHNADDYPDPENFQPERYLIRQDDGTYLRNDQIRDPKSVAFGFGRRICPGRFLADASLFASVVSLLASVTFRCAKDTQGADIVPKVEVSKGGVVHPEAFPYAAQPRSAKTWMLLKGSVE